MSQPTHTRDEAELRDRLEMRLVSGPAEMDEVLAIRWRVFGLEQGIATAAVTDPDDARSLHVIAYYEGKPASTGRLMPPGELIHDAQVAWVATVPEFRRLGIGAAVMRAILAEAEAMGAHAVLLAAQAHAYSFYRDLGFVPFGGRFTVCGIEHQNMIRRPL